MMDHNEVWVPVKDYEGLYEVSNLGRVRSWINNYGNKRTEPKILKGGLNQQGYRQINLCNKGKRKNHRFCRLVATAFLPNPNNLPQVNHIDENKENDNVNNLEWCTSTYNNTYGSRIEKARRKKINHPNLSKPVLQFTLDGKLVKEWPSTKEVGRNGFFQSDVWLCCNGKNRTHKGFIWKYKEAG